MRASFGIGGGQGIRPTGRTEGNAAAETGLECGKSGFYSLGNGRESIEDFKSVSGVTLFGSGVEKWRRRKEMDVGGAAGGSHFRGSSFSPLYAPYYVNFPL